MFPIVQVTVNALGKCEYCGCILNVSHFSAEAINATWKCPECDGELSHESFGFDKATKDAKKVRWVGPDRNWQDEEPQESFQLGELRVLPSRAASYLY